MHTLDVSCLSAPTLPCPLLALPAFFHAACSLYPRLGPFLPRSSLASSLFCRLWRRCRARLPHPVASRAGSLVALVPLLCALRIWKAGRVLGAAT
ncbi:hypothetical protein GQ53DRAFT_749418 [Thozetella sp. PMI_491]|nr:hypothetical protein GQ53DRAFT_749418 [Thozetella sp. PMI_491]